MPKEMKKIERSGHYEILGLNDESGKTSILFVRHSGAPQALIHDSIPDALGTAIVMNRVRKVYAPGHPPTPPDATGSGPSAP